MIDSLLAYLEDSSLVATVLSGITLGFVGVLVKAVLGIAQEVITGGKTIKEQLNISERLNIVEQMLLQNAKIQRASVLGSSLTAENKATVLDEVAKLELMDTQYQIIVEQNKDNTEELAAKIEDLFGQYVGELDALANVAPSASVDMLQRLRDELAATVLTEEKTE